MDILKWFRKRSENGITHHVITIDGSKIHWVEAGNPRAYPLVCVDGWMGSWKAFRRIIPHLEKHYRLIIIDIPGFGESESLRGKHTVTTISEVLRKTTRKIGITRFHLLGLSFGAAVSLRFTATYPSVVSKLAVQGAPFYAGLFKGWMRWGAKFITFPFIIRFAGRLFSNESLVFLLLRAQKDMAFATDDELREKARRTGRSSARAALESAQDVTRLDLRNDAKRIKTPTLIIDGADVRFRPLAAWELLHTLIPHSKLVLIRGATHTVPNQKPDQFAQELIRFFNS